jgi:predicted ArsR family transcriptional regulator
MVFLSFYLLVDEMDFYDRKILTVTKDGKPRSFQQILSEAGFSHNTLRQHLDKLVDQDLVERLKMPRKSPGRPLLDYRLSGGISEQAVSALSNPSLGLVAVSFEGLRRVCRREKGGFCKEIRGRCAPFSCPLVEK